MQEYNLSVKQKLRQLALVRDQLVRLVNSKGCVYPPPGITLLAIKNTRQLEVWCDLPGRPVHLKAMQILAASGQDGPKRYEGDRQVPEGIYRITTLNPASRFHLSLRINYPNEFDLHWSNNEARTDPGGDIYIHGDSESVGCIAIGDNAVEELFVLAADCGISNVTVVITPYDPRTRALVAKDKPQWVAELYNQISCEFERY